MRDLAAWWRGHPATSQSLIALTALAIGVAVYVFDRDASRVYFMPDDFGSPHGDGRMFGQLGGYLPDFLHVFAFILLTCAVLRPAHMGVLAIALGWFFVEAGFEIGQHDALAPVIAGYVPTWFAHIPLLNQTAVYFTEGHFSWTDLLAILLGTTGGYLTVILMPGYDARV